MTADQIKLELAKVISDADMIGGGPKNNIRFSHFSSCIVYADSAYLIHGNGETHSKENGNENEPDRLLGSSKR